MPKIEQYAARGVYDPPAYSQAVKVSGAETILYIAGQVAYDDKGGASHPGDFKAQARAVLQAVKAQVEAGGGTMANIVKVNTYVTDIRTAPITRRSARSSSAKRCQRARWSRLPHWRSPSS